MEVQNDDIAGSGVDACSHVTFALPPGQTRYAIVGECGDNSVIDDYVLDVVFQ